MNLKNFREKIGEGAYLNIIRTDKFKTNLISIYFIRPLSREEATLNALLPFVLRRGTNKYGTSLKIQRRLEEMYGANLSIGINKKGEKQVIRFTIEAVEENYVGANELLHQVIEMFNELINNPLLENEAFLKKYVEQEKENLRKKIKGRINDKRSYAVDRCIEEMCKNEDFGIHKYGYIEDLDQINEKSLYKHYKKLIETSHIEISAVGLIDENNFLTSIKQDFILKRGNIVDLKREEIGKELENKKIVNEKMEVSQGKLTLGYRINIPYENPLYNAFIVGNQILGGGPNSKLFLNVREKESLAYYVYAQTYKFKSIMLLAAGVEFQNYEKAVNIMKKQVEEVKAGKFNDEDIKKAKNSISNSIISLMDSNFSLSEFYLSQVLTKENRNIDEMLKQIKNVNKNEIVEAFQSLSLDTIYFLSNK